MLLYLRGDTWTRGEASEALAEEVRRAMDLGSHILLAHEMPGVGGQVLRFGCDFGAFFACNDGATPNDLIGRGIYSEIAIALKGGPWREASMAMLGMAFGLSKVEAEAAANGKDVLGRGMSWVEQSSSLGSRVVRSLTSCAKIGAALLEASASRLKRTGAHEVRASHTAVTAQVDLASVDVSAERSQHYLGRAVCAKLATESRIVRPSRPAMARDAAAAYCAEPSAMVSVPRRL